MIQSIDLNDIDSIKNVMIVPQNFVNYEELEANEEVIKDQYINFNNLGVDLISNIDRTFLPDIYANMLDFVNETYLSITDFDTSTVLPSKLMETGKIIYEFVCIDCYNTIVPNFLNHMNCSSLDNLDYLIQTKFKGDYSLVKANLVKIIKNITDELLNLQRIDSSVQTDVMYQKLLFKYSYYMELVDFGETGMFVNNYIKPLLTKNLDSILWRTM